MIEEELELIAKRVPPGDRWTLEKDPNDEVINGLVETLNKYVRAMGFKGEFRLAPLQGRLYAIKEVDVEPPKPATYDLYGEFE